MLVLRSGEYHFRVFHFRVFCACRVLLNFFEPCRVKFFEPPPVSSGKGGDGTADRSVRSLRPALCGAGGAVPGWAAGGAGGKTRG